MLRVYYTDISGLEFLPALCHLSFYRQSKLNSTKNELAQKQGAGAELLLIHAVKELWPDTSLPLDIVADEYEKPHLRDGKLHFSLSHSGKYALCAVSDQEVGADIQERKPFNERLTRRFFTAEETEYILAADNRDYAFSKVWAMKESYIKVKGKGLKIPLNSFSVLKTDQGFWHACVGDYHIAVCTNSEEKPAVFREIDLSRLSFG